MPHSSLDSAPSDASPARVLAPYDHSVGPTTSIAGPTDDPVATHPSVVPVEQPKEEGIEEGYGVEEENLEDDVPGIVKPFDPSKISISTKTPIVDLVIKRLEYDEIDLNPDFQRNAGIWDRTRQSRLIESLLLRIPLPVFYMAADKDNKWQVVDGLQRLYSIKSFVLDKTLKLHKMEYLSRFEKLTYDDLPRNMQRRIDETQLAFHVIDADTPPAVMFNVFKRVNTGGKPLTPQEIRHALNPGPARDLVNELAESEEFRLATDYSISPKRMADRECALRFIAFYSQDMTSYGGHLDAFLTDGMRHINLNMNETEKEELRRAFFRSMRLARELFGDNAFRKPRSSGRRSVVNKPLFEALSVALARVQESKHAVLNDRKDALNEMFTGLMADQDFFASISIGTQSTERVQARFRRVKQVIDEVLDD